MHDDWVQRANIFIIQAIQTRTLILSNVRLHWWHWYRNNHRLESPCWRQNFLHCNRLASQSLSARFISAPSHYFRRAFFPDPNIKDNKQIWNWKRGFPFSITWFPRNWRCVCLSINGMLDPVILEVTRENYQLQLQHLYHWKHWTSIWKVRKHSADVFIYEPRYGYIKT